MSLFTEIDDNEGGKTPRSKPIGGADAAPKDPAAPGGYLALARKYRPGAFDEVIGQEAAVATLKNAIAGGRLHHAYLFSGIRGVGKTTAARLFARALNCQRGPTVDPCGECDACREIASGTSMDVIEIDAASNRGVDDVEPLREAARYAPSRDRFKVFILDEVHMLSNAAFNSLLKILEEPPPRIVWILATTEHRKVPQTVVSRCQHFEFRRVSRSDVAAYLGRIAKAEGVEVEPKGLDILAAAAGGSVRDAVSLLDQTIAYAGAKATEEDVRNAIGAIDRRLLLDFLRRVAARDAAGLIDLIAGLAERGTEFSQFAAGLVTTVRDVALLRFSSPGSTAVALTDDEARECRELGSAFGEDGLLRVFNALLDLPFALRGAPQPRFVLEAAALRLTRLTDLAPIEDVIARLEGSDTSGGRSPSVSPAPAPASGAGPTRSSSPGRPAAPETASASPKEAERSAAGESLDPGGATAGNGNSEWRARFVAAAQSRKLSLRACLEASLRITLEGDVVEITLPEKQRIFRDTLEKSEIRLLLAEAASEAAGRSVNISILTEASTTGAPDGDPRGNSPAGRRERLLDAALGQTEVKRLMETFGGQVVDIQDLS